MTIQEHIKEARERLGSASDGEHEIGNLVIALSQLLEAVEQLAAREAPQIPEECRKMSCSYFAHYLVHYDPNLNGEKLDHIPFHHAEIECERAQQRVTDWFDAHDGAEPPAKMPEALEAAALKWERRVCA